MRELWAWTRRNRTAVGCLTAAAAVTTPNSTFLLERFSGFLPGGWWDPKLSPVAASFLFLFVAFRLLAGAYDVFKKHAAAASQRGGFPSYFYAFGLFWPRRIRKEVWEPAFRDLLAEYVEYKPHSDLRILNLAFAWHASWQIVGTLYILVTDPRYSVLARRKRV